MDEQSRTKAELIEELAVSKQRIQELERSEADRKQAEAGLRESEERFHQLTEQSGTIAWEVDAQGLYTYVSHVSEAVLGYCPDELMGRIHFYDLHPESGREAFKQAAFEVFDRKEPFRNLENAAQTKDGRQVWLCTNGIPLLKTDGSLRGYCGSDTEITDRKLAEQQLREAEDRYRDLVENSQDLICTHDLEGKILWTNAFPEKTLGYKRNALVGVNLQEFLVPETRDRFAQYLDEVKKEGAAKGLMHVQTTTGEKRIWEYHNTLRTDGVAVPLIRGIARDITERKLAEAQIKNSLKEKEVLLKEIHHRVKNNLQVISSLLSLQSKHIQDAEARKIFKESQDRVRTMALIHEKLYRSGDLARIEFGDYIQGLVSNLGRSYGLNADKIKLAVQVKDVFLEISTAIPCGLIINELISNALKYGFPDGREGEVLVDMREEGERILLRVWDNGVGFPADLDFRETKSLGLQLVVLLVEQLGGRIELHREGGTEFRISFPKEQT